MKSWRRTGLQVFLFHLTPIGLPEEYDYNADVKIHRNDDRQTITISTDKDNQHQEKLEAVDKEIDEILGKVNEVKGLKVPRWYYSDAEEKEFPLSFKESTRVETAYWNNQIQGHEPKGVLVTVDKKNYRLVLEQGKREEAVLIPEANKAGVKEGQLLIFRKIDDITKHKADLSQII